VELSTVSLFTGVGGLDFGFEAAGFETRVALDNDREASRAVQANRHWPVIEADISQVEPMQILQMAGLRRRQPDILIGGPPCQPFSKSGYWATGDAKRLSDPRADTLCRYFAVLREALPRAFLLENVPGLSYNGKSEGLDLIQRELAAINSESKTNYRFDVATLNAAEFGVPQQRLRVFVVGARNGQPFRFPRRRFGSPDDISADPSLEPFRTAWDALGDLQIDEDSSLALRGKWADLLPSIPEGQNYLWHTSRGGGKPLFGWRRRYWNFLLKLSKRLPSWTIQAQPGPATGPFHWLNRKLSALELARLQSFPDGLLFPSRHADAQKLIGNAVPSALAEVLALEIRRQYFGQDVDSEKTKLLRPRVDMIPRAEPSKPVPKKYLVLSNKDNDHPGTGKGRRAVERDAA
jgi:DNA (cytosine-5)-methyltransferase 1